LYDYESRAIFGGKTRPENMINDVQHTEGCFITWSTSYALSIAYNSKTLGVNQLIRSNEKNACCFLQVLVRRQLNA